MDGRGDTKNGTRTEQKHKTGTRFGLIIIKRKKRGLEIANKIHFCILGAGI